MADFLPNKPPFQEEKSFAMKEWFQSCWRAFRAQNVLAAIQTASFTTDITEYFYPVDTTAGVIVASLPPAANNLGKQYVFKNTTGTNAVTITPSGTDTIDGGATLSLTGINGAAHIVSDGINKWYRVTVSASGVIGAVASVTAANTTLTISPTTGAVVAGLNLGNANVWTANHRFNSEIGINKDPLSVIDVLTTAGSLNGISIQGDANAERFTTESSQSPVFQTGFYNGVVGTRTKALSGDSLGFFQASGHSGSSQFYNNGRMVITAEGDFSTTSAPTAILFQTTPAASLTPATRVKIDSTGVVMLGGLTTANANGGILQLTNGITFPATAVACTDVNTLDDYEEGDWTPVLTFGGGNTGITYGLQAGSYVKIGRLVYATGRLTLTSNGTDTGSAVLGGLPFTIENASKTVCALSTGYTVNCANLTSPIMGYGNINTITIPLLDMGATGTASLDETNFPDTASFVFTITYRAA